MERKLIERETQEKTSDVTDTVNLEWLNHKERKYECGEVWCQGFLLPTEMEKFTAAQSSSGGQG